MQHELPLIKAVRGVERAPSHEVALCKTSGQAIGLAILKSGKTASTVADEIGMERAQLSRIMTGTHHFPADKGLTFARATHSWAWQQWISHQCGMDMLPRAESPEERMARLESENAELRARTAA
jgi:hypothetical protein